MSDILIAFGLGIVIFSLLVLIMAVFLIAFEVNLGALEWGGCNGR